VLEAGGGRVSYRQHSTRSADCTAALVLLVVSLLRLALHLVVLVCRLPVWLLLRLCSLFEAGLTRQSRTSPTLSASDAWGA